jgi:hypothetical protein
MEQSDALDQQNELMITRKALELACEHVDCDACPTKMSKECGRVFGTGVGLPCGSSTDKKGMINYFVTQAKLELQKSS